MEWNIQINNWKKFPRLKKKEKKEEEEEEEEG